MDLISIIVPIYNAEKVIKRCIESISRQSYEMLEIILVDDGSTDQSLEICEDMSEKDSRIKIIHQNNGGVSRARNTGLKKARIVKVNCTLYAYFQRSGSLVSGISVDLVRHLADYTMQKLVSLEDKNLKGIFAEDVIKRMLYVRYYYLLKKERIAAAECNEVIRSMLTLLSHRKVKYVVLYLIPELYRQFRLRNDPSMKIFEKNVKSSDYQCL